MKEFGLAFIALSLAFFAKSGEDQVESNELMDEFNVVENSAFKPGERLVYRFTYGVFDAGEAILSVDETKKMVRGRKLWRVRGIGRTISAFEWFYKVNDRYESYIDAKSIFPWIFVRRVDEGGYIIEQDYTFFQHKNVVDNGEGKKFTVPDMVQDMISAFYYARTLDYDNAVPGDKFLVNIFLDDELYPTEIKYKGKEVVRTRNGKFRCLKFVPVVQEGRVFGSEEDLTVWITDDKNRIPIMARANLKVGSVKMHLVAWEGLSNKMAKVTKKKTH